MAIKLTQEEFINRCRLKHNNKYNYSKSIYVNARTKIDIICPTHGTFSQKATAHLNDGNGCPA
ncbi:MAG: hypothetical protein H8D97_01380 [Proteobacteria bacterium]|nr:hypothetical protein [Pseudomonadota bacterium]